MPPKFMGPSSRTRVMVFLTGHTWDIYGPLGVYLRLNGLVPPASQLGFYLGWMRLNSGNAVLRSGGALAGQGQRRIRAHRRA